MSLYDPPDPPDDDHDERCPAHEDAEPRWSECGGVGKCICYAHRAFLTCWFWYLLDVLSFGTDVCAPIEDPDCACAKIAGDRDADRDEARQHSADLRRGIER